MSSTRAVKEINHMLEYEMLDSETTCIYATQGANDTFMLHEFVRPHDMYHVARRTANYGEKDILKAPT
jgi:hypothetical protein